MQVMAKEGQAVQADQILFRLDDALLARSARRPKPPSRPRARSATNCWRARAPTARRSAGDDQPDAGALLNGAQANLSRLLIRRRATRSPRARATGAAQAQAKLAQDA